MAFPNQPFPRMQPADQVQNPVYAPDLAIRLICPECQDPRPNIVEEYSNGDLVCGSCGLVLGDRIIDDRREWRSFNGEDLVTKSSRVGLAHHISVERSDLGTMIALDDGGSGTSAELRRIAAQGEPDESPSELHVSKAMEDLTSFCQWIELPKVVLDIAKQLYQRIEEENVFPQRRCRDEAYRGTLAACILVACRQEHVPRTFMEISRLISIEKRHMARAFRAIEQVFNVKSGGARGPDDPPEVGTVDPVDLLARLCNYLGIASDVAFVGRYVVKKMQELEIGKTTKPMTVAGSALYFSRHLLGRPAGVEDIANFSCTKGSAILTLYRSLYAMKATLVSQEWLEDGRARLDRLPRPCEAH